MVNLQTKETNAHSIVTTGHAKLLQVHQPLTFDLAISQ